MCFPDVTTALLVSADEGRERSARARAMSRTGGEWEGATPNPSGEAMALTDTLPRPALVRDGAGG